ncbi:MAG TPA: PqqD family protein [Acidimicrobiales bacterium]|nr:PqqD family protein [Acidimicrobiales bacterium]
MREARATERPVARPGLEINEVADGLVIYDGESERVHYLNVTAGVVFSLCTGTSTAEEIADEVGTIFALGRPAEPDTSECIEQLRAEGLIH